MLGHHHAPTGRPEDRPPSPGTDEELLKVQALEQELGVAALTAENTALEDRMAAVSAVRSRLESQLMHGGSAALLQRAALIPLTFSLTLVAPVLDGPIDCPENKFRSAVLEALVRIPVAEIPKLGAMHVLQACHRVLELDHEDNGLVVQRLMFDIHKAHKATLEDQTPFFFEWLKGLFEALPKAVERQLGGAVDPKQQRPLVPARESMRIAIDVALMVFYLMQAYPKRTSQYGPVLVPLMVEMVALPGPDRDAVAPAASATYADFRLAQIKTLAFMVVVSRSQHMGQLLAPHRDTVCGALLRIMATVPDVVNTRKELLTCMRNMLSTPFKAGLQAKVDALLEERTLLGTDRVCVETLRQLAYMNLAELVAATKTELTLDQLRRVVKLYTRNALDTLNPPALQTTSLRLLYNIIEVLFARRAADAAAAEAYRDLLSAILDCMVSKLGALRRQVPRRVCELRDLEAARKQRKAAEGAAMADNAAAGKVALKVHKDKMEAEAVAAKQKQEEAAAAAQAAAAAAGGVTDGQQAAIVKQEDGTAAGVVGVLGAVSAPEAAAAGASVPMATDAPAQEQAAPAVASAAPEAEGKEADKTEPMDEDYKKAADAAEGTDDAAAQEPPPPPFRTLLQATVGVSAKEREILEFRTLLHTVLNCLKNVLYITVAFHTGRGLQQPLSFALKPWSSRPGDLRCVSHILSYGLPAIAFFEHASTPPGFDAREVLADLFTTITDGREFADVFSPRMPFLFDLVLSNPWYARFLRHLLEGDAAGRSLVNRHALACILRFLVSEKLDALNDVDSPAGKLTLELLEGCFEAMPRIQTAEAPKGQTLAHHGLPTVERAALPHVVAFLRASYPRLAAGGPTAQGHMRAMRSLFYSLALTNKFQEIQAAVGATGLHARIVDTALGLMQGPSCRSREAEEAAAELCLLVPARLEHLIPVLPRMMHAAVAALNGSDRSVHVALRVLDVWVESFNPEFIERSMAAVIKPLMAALWGHIRPPPHPFGAKVAEMLGKMGGRGRRWLGEGTSVDYKAIPEYGLRVILAFPPQTSFLVPLDRCVQLAWTTVESPTADLHRRKNALTLLQICVGTLARLSLPADMLPKIKSAATTTATVAAPPSEGVAQSAETAAAAAAPAPAQQQPPLAVVEPKEREPLLAQDALGRLQALLFGDGAAPEIPAELHWPAELGVKTKKQHAAERQMLETVLTALMASAAVDAELEGANAKEFAHATCRHFALLLATGWAAKATPPPAPPSSRIDKYGVRGGIPAYVSTLKHLQPHVLLDAFQAGLKQTNPAARAAVVECMGVFLDTLVEVGGVQMRERAKKAENASADEDKEGKDDGKKDPNRAAAAGEEATATPPKHVSLTDSVPYINVQQDLIMRALHLCYGDTWPARLGGVAALRALAQHVPQRFLMRAASYIIKALMAVLRALPDNAVQEQDEITGVLLDVVRRALNLPESSLTEEAPMPPPGPAPAGAPTPASGPPAAEEQTAMEVEPEEEEPVQTGRRGKRAKRGGAQPPRKRQQRNQSGADEGSPPAATPAATPAAPSTAAPPSATPAEPAQGEQDPIVEVACRLQGDLLLAVLSSKSNDAVRNAGAKSLKFLSPHARTTVGMRLEILIRQETDKAKAAAEAAAEADKARAAAAAAAAQKAHAVASGQRPHDPRAQPAGARREIYANRISAMLERRMLPLRSIATQTNYAHSTAFLLRNCAEQLEFTPHMAAFLADCCTLMELEDSAIASSTVVRGQAPKPDVITKLQVACMESLVAALKWPAFSGAAGDHQISAHMWASPAESLLTVQQLRERMAKVFIRRLGSIHDSVVALATEGLRVTVSNNLLEKTILHEGLRPILMDLAVYQRMTVHLLRHVHRLLDLLSGQFNVTLGQKLTEHLQKWMEADKYLHGQPQAVAWEPGAEWEVAASMLNIFHKLPPAAKEFLETHDGRPGIVVLTIGLEEALYQLPGAMLPSKMWSPYRAPLTRFLNRYAEESVAYFLDLESNRLSKPEYFLRLLDIIRTPMGRPLLEALKSAIPKLAAVLQGKGDDEDTVKAQTNCVHLLRAISKLSPKWLPKELFQIVLERWRSPELVQRAVSAGGLPGDVRERKWLAHLLINYARRHEDEVKALFDLVLAFSLRSGIDFGFVKDFLSKELPREHSMPTKQAILIHWMKLFNAKGEIVHAENSVNVMRYLINPMVLWAITHGQEGIFTPDVAESLVTDVFRRLSANSGAFGEQLQAEVIQLCSIILQHSHELFKDQRKELIQSVWWTLKQDNMAKPFAFLCVAHFFNAFRGVQDNVVLKAFINMVRMPPADAASREAVRQAIDIIVPILVESSDTGLTSAAEDPSEVTSPGTFPGDGDVSSVLSSNAAGKKRPSYAAHLKKVIVDEGLNSATLLVVLQMVVRNRELFFSSRSTFIPLMVNNVSRMGLYNQAPLENRVLAVDMAATLYWWDAAAAAEVAAQAGPSPGGGPEPMDTDIKDDATADGATVAESVDIGSFRLTRSMDESIMNFLVRMAFVSCETRDRDEAGWRKLHAHCLDVLKDAARHRPPSPIKLNFFEKLLQNSVQQQHQQNQHGQPIHEASAHLITGLRVLNIFMEFQPDNFVGCCPNHIAMMIEPAVFSKHRGPVELLASASRSLFTAFPPTSVALLRNTDDTAAVAFKIQTRIREVLTKYLNHIADPQNFSADYFWYGCNCVTVMKAAMEAAPDCMQEVMYSLLKAMNRIAKDHNHQPGAALLFVKNAREVPSDAEYSTGPWFMYHALNIAVPSALVLSAEHRKLFLSTLVMLITGQSVRQGQTDPCILFAVMNLMRSWLLEPNQAHLTHKELLVLLQRLAQVDRLHAITATLKQAWDAQFLDLLYTVITTKTDENFGDDVFMRVERTFCCGLHSSDPAIRQKFFRLYSDRIQRDLHERLRYIIQYQDWDFLSHTFWLKHAVALLFDCLHMRDPITLAYNSAHVPPLFNYKESLKFPGGLLAQTGVAQQPSSKPAEAAPAAGGTATAGGDGGAPAEGTSAGGAGTSAPARVGAGESAAAECTAVAALVPPSPALPGPPPTGSGAGAAVASGSTKGSGSRGGSRGRVPHPVLDLALPDSLRDQLSNHLEFLAQQNRLRSDALVSCLIEQVQTDPLVAHHLWVLLFPIVWTSLQKEQQTGLAKPIISLLSKEHHLRQAYLRPTVGQTLLDGISMSQPQPKIPAEMIKYMGRHFHAWHTAISMLESHVGLFPQDMRCFDAVCDLYAALGEEDMRSGLWQRRAAAEETKTAMALQQHGFLPDAQALYLEMMSRGVSGGVSGVTKSEMVLWHNQYLSCCMELNQWDTVWEYAKSTDNSALQLETAAKLHDWVQLKQMVVPKAQVEEGPEFTMVKAQMQLSEMSLIEVDKLCKNALNLCVVRWWQMPESSPWSYAPVLHSFQRAVELMESWRVMMEFSMQGGPNAQYQDLKDIADTWKLRTPNEWEPVRWWSDVLTWRNQVYNMTIRQFSTLQSAAPTLHQMGYRDKAWSVNRLGHVSRLHHLPEACVHVINTMYGFNTMEVQEAFVKVQEQAKAYMLRKSEYLHGLNLINSTNMDYFQGPHQAEMICLKAQFLHLLNDNDNAHSSFSEALTLWPLCPDAWVNWGRFCDDRYMATKQPQQQAQQQQPLPPPQQPAVWLEFAAACFTQGIRLSGTEARTLVPRLLHLFMLDPQGKDCVGRPLVQQAGDLPAWVWLPWLPQLITSLQRPETAVAKRLLVAAAISYPQYVHWHIRSVIPLLKDQATKAASHAMDRAKAAGEQQQVQAGAKPSGGGSAIKVEGDAEMADAQEATRKGKVAAGNKGAPAAGAQSEQPAAAAPPQPPAGPPPQSPVVEKPMEVIAFDHCKEVLEALRGKQLLALQNLDFFIPELGAKFSSRTEERLLAVVYTLQFRTYKQSYPASSPIPEGLKKELSSVCKACSSKEVLHAANAAATANAPWNWPRCQLEFARDLDPASENTPRTLGELTERLKGWRTLMEAMIEDTLSLVIKLEDAAPALVDLPLEEAEMPCQAPPCPDGPDPVYIERIGADVEVVRRACASSRRITIFGSDGQARTFLVQPATQQMAPGHSEERVGQLLRAANGVMATHPESRRRGLAFAAPRSMALVPNGRIIEDDPSATLYVDAYETYCARYGREPDDPILHFKARTCPEEGVSLTTEEIIGRRRAAYNEIIEKQVTENVFSQYMYKTMVENSRVMWTFKRQFALSVAMSSVACYSLRLTGRIPSKVLVSKARGEVTHLELSALYNDRLQLDMAGEQVPFRLTRNMAAFIGPHGFEGTLVAAAVAAAQGLQQDRTPLPSMLALFLRDDILAFAQRRLSMRSIAAVKLQPAQVEAATMFNVTQCMTRLEKVGPQNSVVPAAVPGGGQTPANPQSGMRELLAAATAPSKLCLMDPTWQPWL